MANIRSFEFINQDMAFEGHEDVRKKLMDYCIEAVESNSPNNCQISVRRALEYLLDYFLLVSGQDNSFKNLNHHLNNRIFSFCISKLTEIPKYKDLNMDMLLKIKDYGNEGAHASVDEELVDADDWTDAEYALGILPKTIKGICYLITKIRSDEQFRFEADAYSKWINKDLTIRMVAAEDPKNEGRLIPVVRVYVPENLEEVEIVWIKNGKVAARGSEFSVWGECTLRCEVSIRTTGDNIVSEEMEIREEDMEIPVLNGELQIIGDSEPGKTLTAHLVNSDHKGIISYSWKMERLYGKGSMFRVPEDMDLALITCEAASDYEKGVLVATKEIEMSKKAGYHSLKEPEYSLISSKINPNISDKFIERKDLAEEIDKSLKDPAGNHLVVLHGLSGIGKTELVKQYDRICRNEGRYAYHLYVTFQNSYSAIITGEDIKILGLEPDKGETATAFEKKIDVLDKICNLHKVLLIIDNLNQYASGEREKYCWKKICQLNCDILVTSTLNWENYGECKRIEILPMEMDECKSLFYSHCHRKCSEEAVCELIEYTGYHTLAIELFAKTINADVELTPAMLLAKLKTSGIPANTVEIMYSKNGEQADSHGIKDHLVELFNSATLLNDNRERDRIILNNMSLMPIKGIPISLFLEWFCDEQERNATKNGINELNKLGWIKCDVYEDDSVIVRLHPLIRDIFATCDKVDGAYKNVERLLSIITDYMYPISNLPKQYEKSVWMEWLNEISERILICCDLTDEVPSAICKWYEKASDRMNMYGYISSNCRRLEAIIDLLEGNGINEGDFEYCHIAMLYGRLGNTYREIPKKEAEAEDLLLKAVAKFEKILISNTGSIVLDKDVIREYEGKIDFFYDYAEALNDLGFYYYTSHSRVEEERRAAWIEDAKKNYNKSLAAKQAIMEYYKERLNKSDDIEKWQDQETERIRRTLSSSYTNLGSIHRENNEFEKAKEFYDRSLALRKVLNDGYLLGILYTAYGRLYVMWNNSDEALFFLEKAKENLGDFGSLSKRTATIYQYCGDAYKLRYENTHDTDDLMEKNNNYREARNIYAKLYGESSYHVKRIDVKANS